MFLQKCIENPWDTLCKIITTHECTPWKWQLDNYARLWTGKFLAGSLIFQLTTTETKKTRNCEGRLFEFLGAFDRKKTHTSASTISCDHFYVAPLHDIKLQKLIMATTHGNEDPRCIMFSRGSKLDCPLSPLRAENRHARTNLFTNDRSRPNSCVGCVRTMQWGLKQARTPWSNYFQKWYEVTSFGYCQGSLRHHKSTCHCMTSIPSFPNLHFDCRAWEAGRIISNPGLHRCETGRFQKGFDLNSALVVKTKYLKCNVQPRLKSGLLSPLPADAKKQVTRCTPPLAPPHPTPTKNAQNARLVFNASAYTYTSTNAYTYLHI